MKQKTGCRSLSFDPQEVDWESCTSPANLGKLLSKPFATNKTMNSEPINFAELLTQRKASAEKTLHEISEVELRAFIAKLPDATHPWKESFTSFIDEHLSETALQGETSDGISFVYYPTSNRGIWYQYQNRLRGVGLLGETSLRVLSEIAQERKS